MRILIITISDKLGGAEQILHQIAKHYNLLRHSVTICIIENQTNLYWQVDGIELIYCNKSIKTLLSLLMNQKFDLVFSSHLLINASLGFLRSVKILKTRYLICRESTTVFNRYKGLKLLKYKLAYYIGYRNIDLLITQSELMKSTLLNAEKFLIKRCKIKTVPNLFEFTKSEITPFDYSCPYIVAAGRLIPEKGFDILIATFNKIIIKYPDLKLIILGDGYLKEKLEQQVNYLGLQNHVNMLGFVEDVYPYFKSAELCVVSSRIEGFPNVLLQMMSQNEKVVSTLCAGGIDELKGVVTCETDSIESLYLAIKESLESTQKTRKLFDEELNSRSIEKFIEKVNYYLENAN